MSGKSSRMRCWRRGLTALLASSLAVALGVALTVPGEALALKTYNQKGIALTSPASKGSKVLKNKNFGTLSYSFKAWGLESTPHVLKTTKGDHAATMTTWAYLPKSYQGSGDMGNPQSVALSPDGHYAYVSYRITSELQKKFKLSSTMGRIVRYDLEKLEQLGVNTGDMTEFVLASRHYRNGATLTSREEQFMSCMKIGPWFNLGHGSGLCYDYKTKSLWFSERGSGDKATVERVSIKTLKPNLRYKLRMGTGRIIGNNLTFDKRGYCYYYSYSGGGWAPKGSIKITRGKIGKKSIKFKTYAQAIRYSPSKNIQSIGYNPQNNRLYLISNGTVVTVPVSKLGKLKKSDVLVSMFDGKREFEGMAFDNTGRGFLLVNKEPELMLASAGF